MFLQEGGVHYLLTTEAGWGGCNDLPPLAMMLTIKIHLRPKHWKEMDPHSHLFHIYINQQIRGAVAASFYAQGCDTTGYMCVEKKPHTHLKMSYLNKTRKY